MQNVNLVPIVQNAVRVQAERTFSVEVMEERVVMRIRKK